MRRSKGPCVILRRTALAFCTKLLIFQYLYIMNHQDTLIPTLSHGNTQEYPHISVEIFPRKVSSGAAAGNMAR